MYTIIQKLITKNRSYESLKPIGIVIHETANPGDSDEMEFNYFNNNNISASAHAFIDKDSITQTIPWNEVAWHAGRTANHKFLGIEMCHATNAQDFQEIWNRTTWLFAYLVVNILNIKTITKDNIMSHAEVSNKWHETDHQDPVFYFQTYGKTVDMFRDAVQNEVNNMILPQPDQQYADDVEYLASYGQLTKEVWDKYNQTQAPIPFNNVKCLIRNFADWIQRMNV